MGATFQKCHHGVTNTESYTTKGNRLSTAATTWRTTKGNSLIQHSAATAAKGESIARWTANSTTARPTARQGHALQAARSSFAVQGPT